MKYAFKYLSMLLPALCVSSQLAMTAQTAQVHLVCISPRFEHGLTEAGAVLQLTSVAPAINGELRADYTPGGFTYQADFFLSNSMAGTVVSGSLVLPPPNLSDSDTNGIADFFEASHPVAWTNDLGTFASTSGTGQVAAIWVRPSGTNTGECQFTFTCDAPALSETYRAPFSFLEYAGPLPYQLGSNGVSSPVVLTQVCHAAQSLRGTLDIARDGVLPYGIKLAAGRWTNQASLTLPYPALRLTRLMVATGLFHRSIYSDVYFTEDGNPETASPDYINWQIAIDDPYDSDGDWLTDLEDTYFANPPRPPTLAFVTAYDQLLVELRGDVGRVHEIQEADSLSATNWQKVASFTLAEDPQLLVAPTFSESARFWRAVAR